MSTSISFCRPDFVDGRADPDTPLGSLLSPRRRLYLASPRSGPPLRVGDSERALRPFRAGDRDLDGDLLIDLSRCLLDLEAYSIYATSYQHSIVMTLMKERAVCSV